jgi:hypothetical protein
LTGINSRPNINGKSERKSVQQILRHKKVNEEKKSRREREGERERGREGEMREAEARVENVDEMCRRKKVRGSSKNGKFENSELRYPERESLRTGDGERERD